MFNNKRKKELIKNEPKDEVTNDFVIHNMPEFKSFSDQTYGNNTKKDKSLNQHHKVGILIFIAGLFLIIALVYSVYNFLIKPTLEKPKQEIKTENVVIPDVILEPEQIAVNEDVSVDDVIDNEDAKGFDFDIASSTTENNNTVDNLDDFIIPEDLVDLEQEIIEISMTDSDEDGLTDNEERFIGTDPNKEDTDNDGYGDLAEINSGYDPLKPGLELDASNYLFSSVIDENLSLLYPLGWEETQNPSNKTVIFTYEEKAFIQLTYQENVAKLDPVTWYQNIFPDTETGESIARLAGQGFYSTDGLTAYLFSNDYSRVYTVYYSTLSDDNDSLPVFDFMIKTANLN